MINYETKKKTVVDAKATENDAMDTLRLSIVQKVLANTAKNVQLEEVSYISEAAEKFISADSIVVTIGDVKNHFGRLTFLAKWNTNEWFKEMFELFKILVNENCYYEDKLGSGFCWTNQKGELCKLEIE